MTLVKQSTISPGLNVKRVLFDNVTCTARTDPEFTIHHNQLRTKLYQKFK